MTELVNLEKLQQRDELPRSGIRKKWKPKLIVHALSYVLGYHITPLIHDTDHAKKIKILLQRKNLVVTIFVYFRALVK